MVNSSITSLATISRSLLIKYWLRCYTEHKTVAELLIFSCKKPVVQTKQTFHCIKSNFSTQNTTFYSIKLTNKQLLQQRISCFLTNQALRIFAYILHLQHDSTFIRFFFFDNLAMDLVVLSCICSGRVISFQEFAKYFLLFPFFCENIQTGKENLYCGVPTVSTPLEVTVTPPLKLLLS